MQKEPCSFNKALRAKQSKSLFAGFSFTSKFTFGHPLVILPCAGKKKFFFLIVKNVSKAVLVNTTAQPGGSLTLQGFMVYNGEGSRIDQWEDPMWIAELAAHMQIWSGPGAAPSCAAFSLSFLTFTSLPASWPCLYGGKSTVYWRSSWTWLPDRWGRPWGSLRGLWQWTQTGSAT